MRACEGSQMCVSHAYCMRAGSPASRVAQQKLKPDKARAHVGFALKKKKHIKYCVCSSLSQVQSGEVASTGPVPQAQKGLSASESCQNL